MLDHIAPVMESVAGRCPYADARHVRRESEQVLTRNGAVERVGRGENEGIGVRVLGAGGGWAFASTASTSRAAVEDALARALQLAEATGTAGRRPSELTPVAPATGEWESPFAVDPFSVPVEDKVSVLLAADAAMQGDPRIVRTDGCILSFRTTTAFASTEGSACVQTLVECGGSISANAVADGEFQVRSYPGGHEGGMAAAGYEQVQGLDLPGAAPRVAEEAVALITAAPCPPGVTTLVLHGEQVALQVHESIGHALELDRILGGEESYAGTSWVPAGDIGSLRYGSELLNVTADATLPGALGSFGWDDEGAAALCLPLIREGVLLEALSSRESAAAVGLERSGGCARAEGHDRQPIVRMTNVSLDAGEAGTLADLIADTDEGIYLETNRSWSIDDRRLHFQFATEVAREIRGGELGRLYRNGSYAGITPEFWGSLDAVCSESDWRLWGVINCGKGEPGQLAHVSHGAAPARFRSVQVGVA